MKTEMVNTGAAQLATPITDSSGNLVILNVIILVALKIIS
jgi:hypothetical protein